MHDVPPLLAQGIRGDEAALGDLLILVEKEQRQVVQHYMSLERGGGLSVDETAEVLKVHPNTVLNDLREAKAWLYCVLNEGEAS